MNQLISYFNTAPDTHRILLLTISFFIFWNLELFIERKNNKMGHLWLNAQFMLTAAPVQFLLAFLMNFTLKFTAAHNFGILRLLNINNLFFYFVASFLILDFCEYFHHFVMHKIKVLWQFHAVHHADQELDVSTTLREHPIETTLRLTFTTFWVFLSGVTLWALIFRQFIQIFSNVSAHADVSIPNKYNKFLSLIIVTPNFHQVHHHHQQPYTDTNYGDCLSIWDRIFGTYSTLSKSDLVFGVDTYSNKNEINTFKKLLILPFHKFNK